MDSHYYACERFRTSTVKWYQVIIQLYAAYTSLEEVALVLAKVITTPDGASSTCCCVEGITPRVIQNNI